MAWISADMRVCFRPIADKFVEYAAAWIVSFPVIKGKGAGIAKENSHTFA